MRWLDWLLLVPTVWMVLYFAVLLHVLPQESFGADKAGIGSAVSFWTFVIALPLAVLGWIVLAVRWAIKLFAG